MRKLLAGVVFLLAFGLLGVLALPLLRAAASQTCGLPTAKLPDGSGGPDGGGGPAGSPTSPGDLSSVQLEHAQTIVAVGEQRQVPAQGVVVALAVASQESRFQNYANDGVVQYDSQGRSDLTPEQRDVGRSRQFRHDAVGTDHGSVNVFQQQYPWWGTLEELMDPPTAAGKFYDALLRVRGWQQLSVGELGQRVQRSAFSGSTYADDEPLARQLLTQLAGAGGATGELSGGLCGPGTALNCPVTGLAAETDLTPDALRVLRCVQQDFGDHTYYGAEERPDNPQSDHPAGRAIDVMIDSWETAAGNAHGWQVARWVQAHAAALGVRYVVFDAKSWNVGEPLDAWGDYTHPEGLTDDNSLHRNHVHVSVFGNAAIDPGPVSGAGWTLPLARGSYRLTSGFGPRSSPGGIGSTNHAGLDFGAPTGTPIMAAATGTVTTAGPAGGFGNLVVIDTGGVQTYYAHQVAGSIAVTAGQQVTAGQRIGAVGTTGNSTGPHLHFEVRVEGVPTDPVTFLRRYDVDPGTSP